MFSWGVGEGESACHEEYGCWGEREGRRLAV